MFTNIIVAYQSGVIKPKLKKYHCFTLLIFQVWIRVYWIQNEINYWFKENYIQQKEII